MRRLALNLSWIKLVLMNNSPGSITPYSFQEKYALINGIEQYFLIYPNDAGTIVLFLHGGPGQTEALFAYKTVLPSSNFTYVYYDQRGTGKTQARNNTPAQDISLAILLDDLDATVDYLHDAHPGKQIALLGHSWGSILGLEYAKLHPEKIAAYVGMGQVVNFKKGERIAFEHAKRLLTEKELRRIPAPYPDLSDSNDFLKACQRFRKLQSKHHLSGYGKGNAAMLNICRKSPLFRLSDIKPYLGAFSTNRNLVDELYAYNAENLTDLDVPIYFICGRNDWQVPSVLTEEYFKTVAAPAKGLYWIEDAGHLTDLDNPHACSLVLNEICRFIGNEV